MRRNKTETTSVGICIGTDVLEYLRVLEADYGCSRSFLINYIIRRHAEQALGIAGTTGEAEPNHQLAPVIQM
jgi:hypothetical protein